MFLKSWVQMGGFELNHYWHRVDVLMVLECALIAMVGCLGLALFGRFVKRSKRLTILSLVGALSFATAAWAANTALSALTAAGAISGTNLFYVVQASGVGGVKATATQVATFINSLFSGDATVTSGGVITVSKTGGVAFAPSATTDTTNAANITVGILAAARGGAGTITGALKGSGAGVVSQAACADLSNASASCATDATNASNIGSGTLNTLRLPSPFTSGTKSGSTSSFGTTSGTLTSGHCVSFDASGNLVDAGAACGGSGSTGANPTATAGPTAVNGSATTFMRSDGAPAVQTATTSQLGLVQPDGSTIKISAGVISAAPQVGSRTVTGTTDAIVSTDLGNIVYYNSASAVAASIAQAGTTGFAANTYFGVCNVNAGAVTITPTTSTIGGAATLVLQAGSASHPNCTWFRSDGTNYTIADKVVGAGVTAAMGNALSASGGLTSTVASGTAALGTSAIASAACATAVSATATGVATTDTVTASFNGDPTAVTGYIPSTSGMLTIFAYPTSGNVNFKVCNNTSASVTPGALTLNWRVTR